VSFFLFFGPKWLEMTGKRPSFLLLGTIPAFTHCMNKFMSIVILAVSINASLVANALGATPSRQAAQGQQQNSLEVTAQWVRYHQAERDKAEASIKAYIKNVEAYKKSRESEISKLESLSRQDQKSMARDGAAGQAARQGYGQVAQERGERYEKLQQLLAQDIENLNRARFDLKNQVQYHELKRDAFLNQLKAQAEQTRYAAYCSAGMAHDYKPASTGGFSGFMSKLGRSGRDKTEAQIQAILQSAPCMPMQAVNQSRATRQPAVEPAAQSSAERAVPRAIPVGQARATSASSSPRQANVQAPY